MSIIDIEEATSHSVTPASLWTRPNGKQSRLLFVSNTGLPDSLATQHPQMAVYLDENDNVLTIPLNSFLSKRTFSGVDPELEAKLNSIFETSEDDFSLDDTLNVVDSSDTEEEETSDEKNDAGVAITFIQNNGDVPQTLTPSLLKSHVVSYSQKPDVANNRIEHTVLFAASDQINQDSLNTCFNPMFENENAIYSFIVDLGNEELDVDWDSFIGVYPAVAQGSVLYNVIFTTNQSMHIESEPVSSVSVAGVESQPEVQDTVVTMIAVEQGLQVNQEIVAAAAA